MNKKTTLLASFVLATVLAGAQDVNLISILADDGSVMKIKPSTSVSAPVQGGQTTSMLCDTVLTTLAAGNGHRGNMFDITAINTITITSFDGHPSANTDIQIYTRPGTHVGFVNSSTGWTLVGTATNVTAQTQGTPTQIPIPVNVQINNGQTQAFYITSTNTAINLHYTDGTSVGNVYKSNADLQFKEGAGLEYPFTNGGSAFTPRIWNGVIRYCTGTTGAEKEMTVGNVKAYPNPFSAQTTISLSHVPSNAVLTVYDVLGNAVRSISSISTKEVVLGKEGLSAGVYFYSVKDTTGLDVKGKVVVE